MPEDLSPTLHDSSSPFLQHGAEQPVSWMPWSRAPFERARRENRPVLLDIGGVWCHWCHVMDHESYEDPETAGLINELFVPVKVDRDERPDVDARYQRAVQAISGQGGWPLTAFLTPEGEVFYGGTYFPPEDRMGRPAFRRVLNEVARVWTAERERALEMAQAVRARLSAAEQAEAESGEASPALIDDIVEEFAQAFDFRDGGFGRAPKFPNPGALLLLLDRTVDRGEDWSRRVVDETLAAMGRGGVYDQLGGGFHRYATDAHWRVPHFEKMAYDNGALLDVYSRAYAVAGEPLYRDVAEGIVDYYRKVAPKLVETGGFPASQDADIGPDDDGGYWTWTMDEVRDALGAAAGSAGGAAEHSVERLAEAARLRYGLDDSSSALHSDRSRHVPFLAMDVAEVAERLDVGEAEADELLAEARRRLLAEREERPSPYVDDTLYTGWLALVASGHLAAGRYLELDDATGSALRALDRAWDEAFDAEDGIAHRVGDGDVGGYLEDQAYTAQALLDAFEATQRPEYLDRARQLADVLLRRFRDPESGAFGDRPRDEEAAVELLERPHRPITDSPTPAGNAVAALVLLRLAALGQAPERYRERALDVLNAFAGSAEQMAPAMATYARAADWAFSPVTTVVVVGEPGDDGADALLETALATYRPRTVVRRVQPGAVPAGELPEALAAMLTGEAPRAYVCSGRTCAPPVGAEAELEETLRTFGGG